MIRALSHTLTRNETFPLKQNLTCANYGTYVTTCVIWNQQYVGQTLKKCPRDDDHRAAVIGTNQIIGLTTNKMA